MIIAEKDYQNIFFVGIKGVGVMPIAVYCKQAGATVSGSDIADEFITDVVLEENNISVSVGFEANDLPENTDLVIATGAHGGFDNPQVKEAREKGITVWMQGEALGKIMQNYSGIAVAGSHGKTTTSGLLSTMLVKADLDPSYLVGSGSIIPLGAAGHFGKGSYLVVEADEYANEPKYDKTPKILFLKPKILIITNIDFDHPDIYSSIEDVKSAFVKLTQQMSKDSVVIINGDSPHTKSIIPEIPVKVITYGEDTSNDYFISHVGTIPQKTTFYITHKDKNLGHFLISLAGNHNALNATAALIAALEVGVSLERAWEVLPIYQGAKRRFEKIAESKNTILYDDYAHHPNEITSTIQAARSWFPNEEITIIFQPHTYSRTKSLLSEFVEALQQADKVIVTDIYASMREDADNSINSSMIAKAIGDKATYIGNKDDVVQYFDFTNENPQVLFTMGAGDIYKILPQLKEKILQHKK